MSGWLDRMLARVRAVFTKPALDAEFDAELTHHIEMLTADNVKAGMNPDEARRQANMALGGTEQLRELHRETRGLPWLEQFWRDLLYTVRMARRERGFTVVALSILAVGIGLNTTVFSLVNTVLLRPIPFAHADQLVWIFNGDPAGSSHNLSAIASEIYAWEGLNETSRTIEQIEAYNPFSVLQTFRLTGSGDPETIVSVDVSHGLFDMLGVSPLAGRLFLPEDGVPNAPGRVILTHQLWQRRYASDPHLVGKMIQINGEPVEVVGILPPADAFTSVFFPAVRVDVYAAIRKEQIRRGNTVTLIGRVKPALNIETIRADLRFALAQSKKHHPEMDQSSSANVIALHDWVAGSLERPLLFLWIAAGFVLAIVSFNLGGLLLARGALRQKELALRCALGAGRNRIARQLLTECLAMVVTGSIIGGVIAWGFIRVLATRSSVEIPLLQSLRLDAIALGFTVLVTAITVVSTGVFPAWTMARELDLQHSLKDGGRHRSRTRSVLVIAEIALACVLTISAGLLVQSFIKLLKVNLGFQPDGLIAVRIDPKLGSSQANFLENVLDRVRAIPGVEHAAITDCIPVERDRSWWIIYSTNKANPKDQRGTGAHIRLVSPGLFASMGTTLIAGRDFNLSDKSDSPTVIVVNQSLAHEICGDADPLGRVVSVLGTTSCLVIGVVADIRHDGPEVPVDNEMYLSLHQVEDAGSWDMMVRTKLPVATLTAELRDALREIDPNLPLSKVRPMQSLVDRTLSSRRLLAWLIGGFAAIAVGLAGIGLYGVISYMVAQQTKEIGIRMALGAEAATIRRQIVRQTMKLALVGLTLGLGGAFAVGHGMQSLLYGVASDDLVIYLIAASMLFVCAMAAGYLPARRASRVDPLIALRAD